MPAIQLTPAQRKVHRADAHHLEPVVMIGNDGLTPAVVKETDAARIAHLVELAIEFSQAHLKPGGALVTKVFHGSGYSQLVKLFKETFKVVKPIKPKSSRDKSSETFLVGMGLR